MESLCGIQAGICCIGRLGFRGDGGSGAVGQFTCAVRILRVDGGGCQCRKTSGRKNLWIAGDDVDVAAGG